MWRRGYVSRWSFYVDLDLSLGCLDRWKTTEQGLHCRYRPPQSRHPSFLWSSRCRVRCAVVGGIGAGRRRVGLEEIGLLGLESASAVRFCCCGIQSRRPSFRRVLYSTRELAGAHSEVKARQEEETIFAPSRARDHSHIIHIASGRPGRSYGGDQKGMEP
ncbi:hypothetical protein B0H11DRAFT_1335712 [Mycena galericulata]|nr:hypothetical protein B0H11DRAFT_1335712 [Mycena galericulata]